MRMLCNRFCLRFDSANKFVCTLVLQTKTVANYSNCFFTYYLNFLKKFHSNSVFRLSASLLLSDFCYIYHHSYPGLRLLPHNLLKVRLRMLTNRTDEIIRQLLANPLISAYAASPYSLPLRCRTNSLRLWLDIILVILVCH